MYLRFSYENNICDIVVASKAVSSQPAYINRFFFIFIQRNIMKSNVKYIAHEKYCVTKYITEDKIVFFYPSDTYRYCLVRNPNLTNNLKLTKITHTQKLSISYK